MTQLSLSEVDTHGRGCTAIDIIITHICRGGTTHGKDGASPSFAWGVRQGLRSKEAMKSDSGLPVSKVILQVFASWGENH